MTETPLPSIVPFGDQALLVAFGEDVDEALNRRAHALAAAVRADRESGGGPWGSPVPGYASLLVPYDVRRTDAAGAADRLAALAGRAQNADTADDEDVTPIEIPVRYGGEGGPDLGLVAAQTGLDDRRVVELHASVTYRVFLLGFVPGFAYLGTLPAELDVPRRAEPRTRVPAGSVAIAGRQTAVYPLETPGGWQLIGITDVRPWDPDRVQPALLLPGTRVRFVPLPG